jgi:hypothetical protein
MQLKQGTFCPLIKKDCIQTQCSWFTQLRGTHPQTGQEIDEWMCAISAFPMLQIEVAKQARSGAAATESFRNEFVNMNGANPLLNAITKIPPLTNNLRRKQIK